MGSESTSFEPRPRVRVESMSCRQPLIVQLYEKYLIDYDSASWVLRVSQRYSVATLERLAIHGTRKARRAAVFALGYLGSYDSNAILGRALIDRDRGVRVAADTSIRKIWHRAGTAEQQQSLRTICQLNDCKHWGEAIRKSTHLIQASPWIAEAWFQRGLGYWQLSDFDGAIRDYQQALEINPYHFAAAAGIGRCHLEQGSPVAALHAFRRALRLNPGLEEIRAQIIQIQRALNDDQAH